MRTKFRVIVGIGAAISLLLIGAIVVVTQRHADTASPTPTDPLADSPAHTTAMVSASQLVDSIGVGTHVSYDDTAYADLPHVISLLQDLGVRHVREAAQPSSVPALEQLGRAGIRSDLIVSGTQEPDALGVDQDQVGAARELSPYLDSLELPNEYDCSGDPRWDKHLHEYAASLRDVLRADRSLAQTPVLGPAFCHSFGPLFGSVTGFASVANLHAYSGGLAPEQSLETRVARDHRAQGPDLPVEITETGYQNALGSSSDNQPVRERAAADYTLRTVLDAIRSGVSRTYLYELLDEKADPGLTDAEQHFGLVRFDGTPKPAYTALRHLIADVSRGTRVPVDTDPLTQTDAPVTVIGGGSLVREVAVADPTGSGLTLALWLDTPLERSPGGRPTDQRTTVTVASDRTYEGRTRRPSGSNVEKRLGSAKSFSIDVTGAVTLLHLQPAAGAAPTAATPAACTAGAYEALTTSYAALLTNPLSPTSTTWSDTVVADPTLPDRLPVGATIGAGSPSAHLDIPSAPTRWTVTLWERTDSEAKSFSDFVHLSDGQAGHLRTYDLDSDPGNHEQISAYGPATPTAEAGVELFGSDVWSDWHLIALSNDGTRAVLSIDGQVESTGASAESPLSSLDIGGLSPGFIGSVGSVAVFPTALTTPQLRALATTSDRPC